MMSSKAHQLARAACARAHAAYAGLAATPELARSTSHLCSRAVVNDRGGTSAGAPPAATPGSAANGAASVAPPGLRQQPAGAGAAALDASMQAALARELQELLNLHSVVSIDDLR